MRIISQDGMIDCAYDLGNLSIATGKIDNVEISCIYYHSCCSTNTKLAEYKSCEQAKKALKLLRNTYKANISQITNVTYFKFPNNDAIEGVENET